MNLSSLRTFLFTYTFGLLAAYLPKRMKRLILLASISGRFKEPETFNNETLAKLNRVMEMGKRDSALMPAVHLSRAIWHGKTSSEIIEDDPSMISSDESRITRAAYRIYELSPKWLRYGDTAEMLSDLMKLLRVQPALLS